MPSSTSLLTGQLTDAPIPGLEFRTPTTEGCTDAAGRFSYTDGEDVEFALGPISIGTARGAAEITARDLMTSHADLLQTLGAALAAGKLTPAEARNELRRALNGIVRETDVRIPARDGSYLLADVFRPAAPGRYPVLLRLSVYGRAFGMGSIMTEDDRLAAEVREDQWFSQPRDALPGLTRLAENAVSANTFDWVPRGYVCVRVDSRGVGRTPGTLAPFSPQEARDYYDAIEWAAAQDWSDGNVGLYGSSYTGTNQWNVANLQPPSLKAIMPWAADGDAYRELAYPGGILAEGYRRNWWAMVTSASPGSTHSDFYTFLEQHPFDDPAAYGPGAPVGGADYQHITVPALVCVSQGLYLHARGGFEAFEALPSPATELVVSAADYFPFMYQHCLDQQFAFFDRHLKGHDTEPGPRVRIAVRTGGDGFSWLASPTWPPTAVTSRTYYLDASDLDASDLNPGAGRLGGTGQLGNTGPVATAVAEYSADPAQTGGREFAGASFLTAPTDTDLDVIGHPRATLWVSSTSHDMDVFVALRVIKPDGTELLYANDPREPMASGSLKVSHRRTDPERSNARRPWHTHRREDVQPLRPGEVAEIEVEIMGASARMPAGSRLRLDVHPVERNGDPLGGRPDGFPRAYDRSYHDGARNQIHTGPGFPSRLELPVMPAGG